MKSLPLPQTRDISILIAPRPELHMCLGAQHQVVHLNCLMCYRQCSLVFKTQGVLPSAYVADLDAVFSSHCERLAKAVLKTAVLAGQQNLTSSVGE